MRKPPNIQLSPHEENALKKYVERFDEDSALFQRAKIILLADLGMSNIEIAEHLNITRQKVGRWREKYFSTGLDGIKKGATRPGGKPPVDADIVQKVIDLSLNTEPQNGAFWTQKTMAKKVGISISSVGRIWRNHGISPSRTQRKN